MRAAVSGTLSCRERRQGPGSKVPELSDHSLDAALSMQMPTCKQSDHRVTVVKPLENKCNDSVDGDGDDDDDGDGDGNANDTPLTTNDARFCLIDAPPAHRTTHPRCPAVTTPMLRHTPPPPP
ncbi:hypothetical protein E4U21_001799 [Claviceps maximensis]|nr:hypothetical protein E4U21_001799 [Claviceps maximensis]